MNNPLRKEKSIRLTDSPLTPDQLGAMPERMPLGMPMTPDQLGAMPERMPLGKSPLYQDNNPKN